MRRLIAPPCEVGLVGTDQIVHGAFSNVLRRRLMEVRVAFGNVADVDEPVAEPEFVEPLLDRHGTIFDGR